MANILLAFHNGVVDKNNPNALPIFYESFIAGLDREENNVYVFSDNWFMRDFEEIEEDLKQEIQNMNLDICILFNNCFFDLSEIVDCPIVIYEADSPLYFSNKDKLISNPERFLYFVAQTDSIEIIKAMFGVSREKIFYVPHFTEIQADEKVCQDTNISFIGSKMIEKKNVFRDVLCKMNLSEKEWQMYAGIIEKIKENPSIATELIDSEVLVREICMSLSCEKRIHVLSAIVDLGLVLYGNKQWSTDYYYDIRLNLAFNRKKVYSLEHNQQIYNSSKISINVSHLQATSGFPWRVMDIMASNACLVTDYHEDFKRLFPKIPFLIYTSEYEAREQCRRLLEDDIMRKEITMQCQEIINEKYRFKHLLRAMEEYTGITMHE